MQNLIESIIVNHDNEAGFHAYSIDYGPHPLNRRRARFSHYQDAAEFAAMQEAKGNSVGVFYIFDN